MFPASSLSTRKLLEPSRRRAKDQSGSTSRGRPTWSNLIVLSGKKCMSRYVKICQDSLAHIRIQMVQLLCARLECTKWCVHCTCAVCISLWYFFGCLSLTLDILVALGNVSWILLLAAATRVKRFRHQDPQRRIVRWCDMLKHEFPAFFPDLVSGEIWRKTHINIYSYFILILNHVWICLNGFEWSKTFKNHACEISRVDFPPKPVTESPKRQASHRPGEGLHGAWLPTAKRKIGMTSG